MRGVMRTKVQHVFLVSVSSCRKKNTCVDLTKKCSRAENVSFGAKRLVILSTGESFQHISHLVRP